MTLVYIWDSTSVKKIPLIYSMTLKHDRFHFTEKKIFPIEWLSYKK